MPTKSFPLTPAQVASFRSSLIAHDIDVPEGDSVVIKPGWGVQLRCDYNGADTLTITILKTGWGDAPTIWAKINQYLPSSGA